MKIFNIWFYSLGATYMEFRKNIIQDRLSYFAQGFVTATVIAIILMKLI